MRLLNTAAKGHVMRRQGGSVEIFLGASNCSALTLIKNLNKILRALFQYMSLWVMWFVCLKTTGTIISAIRTVHCQ